MTTTDIHPTPVIDGSIVDETFDQADDLEEETERTPISHGARLIFGGLATMIALAGVGFLLSFAPLAVFVIVAAIGSAAAVAAIIKIINSGK